MSNVVNQRTATCQTILGVLAERNEEYVPNGPTPISAVLTDSDKQKVRDQLFAMFREGMVTYKPEFQATVQDDKELRKYISGLVNNWIRKAKEFNCGEKYKAKNPGSRAHLQDKKLKNLMSLATQVGQGNEGYDEIMEAIVERKAEIATAKAKSVEVNPDFIPDSLKHLIKN